MKSPPRSCGTCSAWQPNEDHIVKDGTPQRGWCKAHAPRVFEVLTTAPGGALHTQGPPQVMRGWVHAFPPIDAANWCREWQSRDMEEFSPTVSMLIGGTPQ